MTNRLLAPAPYARFQTSGRSYTADLRGVIAAAAIGDIIDLIRSGCNLLRDDDKFTAVMDPTEVNDQTQGFSVGSRWFNTMGARAWVCLSAASGAATWILDGVVPGTGAEPSNMRAYFGGGTGTLVAGGSLVRQLGNPLAGNGADTTDDVLASYALPASSLDVSGRGLCITARGMTGPTSNDKRVKLWFDAKISAGMVTGGSVIANTGAWVDTIIPNNNVGWQLTSNVFKLGLPGSNIQYAQGSAILGGVHAGIGLPVFPTGIEAGAIVIALTGSSYSSAAANDLVANWFEVTAMN
jgi:hypothetical protein